MSDDEQKWRDCVVEDFKFLRDRIQVLEKALFLVVCPLLILISIEVFK